MTIEEEIYEYEMQEKIFDEINGITEEDKKMWKEMKRIENEKECPKCKKKELVNFSPNNFFFLCRKCGYSGYIEPKMEQ